MLSTFETGVRYKLTHPDYMWTGEATFIRDVAGGHLFKDLVLDKGSEDSLKYFTREDRTGKSFDLGDAPWIYQAIYEIQENE